MISTYEGAARVCRDNASSVIAIIGIRQKTGDDSIPPPDFDGEIDEKYLKMSTKELEELRKQLLREWELYLYKLIKLDPTNEAHKLNLAESAHQQGKTALVASLLTELAPDEGGGNEMAHLVLGNGFAKQNRWPQAIRHMEHALVKNSEFTPARYNLIRVLIKTGEFVRAKPHVDKIFKDHLLDYPNLLNFALNVYDQTQDRAGKKLKLGDAVLVLRDQVLNEESPKNSVYWQMLLTCYVNLGDFEAFEKLLTQVIARAEDVDKRNAHRARLIHLWTVWASSLATKKDDISRKRRLELLLKAFREDPNNLIALRQLSSIALGDSPEAAEARAVYDPLADKGPPAGVHIELSTYYLEQTKKAETEGDEDGILAGRNKAIYHLEKARELEPNDNQTANNLAYLLIQQGDQRIDEALRLSMMATQNAARTGDIKSISNFLDTLGHVQMAKATALRNDNPSKSRQMFLEASKTLALAQNGRPNAIGIMKSRAYCFRAVNDIRNAELLEMQIAELERKIPKQ